MMIEIIDFIENDYGSNFESSKYIIYQIVAVGDMREYSN